MFKLSFDSDFNPLLYRTFILIFPLSTPRYQACFRLLYLICCTFLSTEWWGWAAIASTDVVPNWCNVSCGYSIIFRTDNFFPIWLEKMVKTWSSSQAFIWQARHMLLLELDASFGCNVFPAQLTARAAIGNLTHIEIKGINIFDFCSFWLDTALRVWNG